MNDGKTHAASYNKLFKSLGRIKDQLYEVELAESGIEHKEPVVVGFFILQHDKLRMLELYYNLFTKFCDTDKYEEMEMETDSLYLALAEEKCKNVYEVRKSKSGSCYAAKTAKYRSLHMLSALYSLRRVVLNAQET